MIATAPIHTTPNSCWTKMRNCLCNQGRIQHMKAALWTIGGDGFILLPVPLFVKGAACFSSLFMAGHAISQHPDSACMQGRNRPTALSRTWKHITAGATIAGVSGGLGMLAFSTNNVFAQGIGAAIIGCGCIASIAVAYSDRLFMGEYTLLEDDPSIEIEAPPLVLHSN